MTEVEYKNKIKRIIEAGNLAPSGGNSQPWRFFVKKNTVRIELVPERDNLVLNYKKRGTYIALGALLENFSIASKKEGLELRVDEIPVDEISSVTVHFSDFSEQKLDADVLYEQIFLRHSNRSMFKREPLSQNEKVFLFEDLNKFFGCEIGVVQSEEEMIGVARELCLDTVISMQNEFIHKQLFKEILWKEKDQKSRHGIFVHTLEMTFPKVLVFRLLSNWRVANFVIKHFKILDKIRSANISVGSSGAMIGLIMTRNTGRDFVNAGRLMQNVWLRASRAGLNFHLMAGMLFLCQRASFDNNPALFSSKEKQILIDARDRLMGYFGFGAEQEKIGAVAFRVGRGKGPLAVSYKRPPEIYWS